MRLRTTQTLQELKENVGTILALIYSVWVNVSDVTCTLEDTQIPHRNKKNQEGFLFPSKVASWMLVETDDLIPVIASII